MRFSLKQLFRILTISSFAVFIAICANDYKTAMRLLEAENQRAKTQSEQFWRSRIKDLTALVVTNTTEEKIQENARLLIELSHANSTASTAN